MAKGYICLVQNNSTTDYLRLAYALALSIRNTQSKVRKLSIVTDQKNIPQKYKEVFDNIIEIRNDRATESDWKLHNIVDLYEYTPYDETVMLDSDMLFLDDISHWWDKLQERDLWFTTNTRTYMNETAPLNTIYREEFLKNNLPSLYNAFFYFKKSENTERLFNEMKLICENWDYFVNRHLYKRKPKMFSTDVAFGLAVKILGLKDKATLSELCFPYFTHMKTTNQNWNLSAFELDEDWTKYPPMSFDKFNDTLGIKIGNVRQFGILHYHIKSFLTDEMLEILEDVR